MHEGHQLTGTGGNSDSVKDGGFIFVVSDLVSICLGRGFTLDTLEKLHLRLLCIYLFVELWNL